MRKRTKRKYVPVLDLPLTFGHAPGVRQSTELQVRSMMVSLLEHKADIHALKDLLRVALFCTDVTEVLIKTDRVEADGLADTIVAVNEGSAAMIAVFERLKRTDKIGTAGPEREPLLRLVDAYEALFPMVTRRECVEVMVRVDTQLAAMR